MILTVRPVLNNLLFTNLYLYFVNYALMAISRRYVLFLCRIHGDLFPLSFIYFIVFIYISSSVCESWIVARTALCDAFVSLLVLH